MPDQKPIPPSERAFYIRTTDRQTPHEGFDNEDNANKACADMNARALAMGLTPTPLYEVISNS